MKIITNVTKDDGTQLHNESSTVEDAQAFLESVAAAPVEDTEEGV